MLPRLLISVNELSQAVAISEHLVESILNVALIIFNYNYCVSAVHFESPTAPLDVRGFIYLHILYFMNDFGFIFNGNWLNGNLGMLS